MQMMNKDRLIAVGFRPIISLVGSVSAAPPVRVAEACRNRIMKGTAMNIKLIESGRVARYGTALGAALHAVWSGLVWLVVPGDFDRHHLRGR